MSLIEWRDEFSVGHPEVDAQHRIWISIYNEAHDRMMDPDDKRVEAIGLDALARMRDYTRKHFAFEEAYMDQIGYPDAENHKRIHDRFAREIDQYLEDSESGAFVLNSEVIKRLENWLVHHILKEDMSMKGYAAGR